MIKDVFKFIITNDLHMIVIYALLAYIAYCVIKKIILKKTNVLRKKRQKSIEKLIKNIIKYLLIIAILLKTLAIIGIDLTGVIAGLGIAGVVLGLALQDIMKDILVGISIVFEDQFDIGDYVEINGFEGTIVDLTLKSTKIQNLSNTVKIISNRTISEVINYSKSNPNLLMDIPVSYEIKNSLADKVIDNITKRIEKEVESVTGEVKLLGLNEFKDSSINYRIMIPVTKDSQFGAKRQINRIIKEEFDKEKISIPYNIIEVKNG